MKPDPPSYDGLVITEHALERLGARSISVDILNTVLREPDSIIPVRPGRVVAQRIVWFGSPSRDYLVRVFIDIDRQPPEVVTAYRTSKIRKYTGEG